MPTTSNRRILLVDDNRAIHDDFKKILSDGGEAEQELDAAEAALLGTAPSKSAGGGFELESAYQGAQALELVQASVDSGKPYAMAFMDVRMPPGWDGIETSRRIWEVDPDLQVVICTAYSDYSWDEMIEMVGQSDRLVILKKPFDNVEVLQLAYALVTKWQLFQDNRRHVEDLEHKIQERTMALEQVNGSLQEELGERNRMEVQLRHAQKMESIGQLAAGIAHEINTPIQYIGDNTRFIHDAFKDIARLLGAQEHLLAAVKAGTETAELVTAVDVAAQAADVDYLIGEIPSAVLQTLDGVERVTAIVRSMKDFSHPSSNEKKPLDLNRAIESTLTVCRNEWKYVAEMVTEFDDTLPPVLCLPGEINQTVLNLVVNAAHAITDALGDETEERGTIAVSTRRDGDWAEIRVRDTGTGIPESARGKIFDPFFTTKAVGRGTGQGLAIIHSVVVDKHNGDVRFETELGKGTTFIIRLPLTAANNSEEQ